jgi:hypothetical protein
LVLGGHNDVLNASVGSELEAEKQAPVVYAQHANDSRSCKAEDDARREKCIGADAVHDGPLRSTGLREEPRSVTSMPPTIIHPNK